MFDITLSLSSFFSSLTVWKGSRKLWQVLHAHAARTDPSRPAGHRQHRPGRVRWLLLHQPSVYPSISAQRGMRRKHSKRPMTNRLSLFSSFCIWESCNLRELALISNSYPVVHYLVQLRVSRLPAVVFCRPTAFYLVNECVSVSVTISFGVKGTIRFSLTSPQCTKRQKHFPPTPTCSAWTLSTCLLHFYTEKRVSTLLHECQSRDENTFLLLFFFHLWPFLILSTH